MRCLYCGQEVNEHGCQRLECIEALWRAKQRMGVPIDDNDDQD